MQNNINGDSINFTDKNKRNFSFLNKKKKNFEIYENNFNNKRPKVTIIFYARGLVKSQNFRLYRLI